MTENRLLGADFVRAAACLTVLFHHLAQRMSWEHELGFMEWFRLFAQMGTYGVAMFFVLSGYLLSRSFWQAHDARQPMPSLKVYAMRRGARILPGFWLALILAFVLSIVFFEAKLDWQLVLRLTAGVLLVADWHWVTLFPVEVNGPLWSICFEITSYVLLPAGFALMFLGRRWIGTGWRSRMAWLGVIALALVAHWLFVKYYRVDFRQRGWDYGLIGGAKLWMPRYNPFAFFAMFAIGALAGGAQVMLSKQRNMLFDILALVGLGLGLYSIGLQMRLPTPDSWGWLGIPYGFPWFVLTVALFLATAPSSAVVGQLLDNPLSRYLARISFGIYIYHYIVLELVRVFWAPDIDHGQMADPIKFLVTSFVITAITIVAAHLSFHLLENPIIQWARGKERDGADAGAVPSAAAS